MEALEMEEEPTEPALLMVRMEENLFDVKTEMTTAGYGIELKLFAFCSTIFLPGDIDKLYVLPALTNCDQI